MSAVFVDTSAILALLVANDVKHSAAIRAFESLHRETASLFSTSYVLVETYALLGHRHGKRAVRRFRDEFVPLLDIVWVDEELHENALNSYISSNASRSLSLVDLVSFAAMRLRGTHRAFAFDRHFSDSGFEIVK